MKKNTSNDYGKLKVSLMKTIAKHCLPVDRTLQALSEIREYYLDRIKIENLIKETDFQAVDFYSNDSIELLYKLKKGRQHIGYIMKIWSDPGFQIGKCFVAKQMPSEVLKNCILSIIKFCTVRGFPVSIEDESGNNQLIIETVEYSEELTTKALIKILENLTECNDKINKLLR